LKKERNAIAGQNVLLIGDLKNGRTVHSLVYGLARFGAHIITMPGEGLELPSDVSARLESEFGCKPWSKDALGDLLEKDSADTLIDAVYVAPSGGQQYTLLKQEGFEPGKIREHLEKIDVCYVTRLQGERLTLEEKNKRNYPIVDEKFLGHQRYSKAHVLHPLPRVSELGYELDRDPRGIYFKQAGYGVPVRMALIAKVLGIVPFKSQCAEQPLSGQICKSEGDSLCPNRKCITNNPIERRYLPNKAVILRDKPTTLRCLYCDTTVRVAFEETGRRENVDGGAQLRLISEAGRAAVGAAVDDRIG
jgi:aspartate carbamoyltransferase catalytic subunit